MIIIIIFSFFCQCYFKFLIYLVFIKIRSINTTPTTRFSIALLSVKENARRTANVICLPNHIIWKMKTFEEVKAFLVKSFPQIDFSTFVTDKRSLDLQLQIQECSLSHSILKEFNNYLKSKRKVKIKITINIVIITINVL